MEERTAKMVPLGSLTSISAILDIDDRYCAQSAEYLAETAHKHKLPVNFLLVNRNRRSIPGWFMKENVAIINYGTDFDRRDKYLNGTIPACISRMNGLLICLCSQRISIVEKIVQEAPADFKIGKNYGKDTPFDLSVKLQDRQQDENLAEELVKQYRTFTEGSWSTETDTASK